MISTAIVSKAQSGCESLLMVRSGWVGGTYRETEITERERKLGLRCEVPLMRTSKQNGSTVRKYN